LTINKKLSNHYAFIFDINDEKDDPLPPGQKVRKKFFGVPIAQISWSITGEIRKAPDIRNQNYRLFTNNAGL